MHSDSRSNELSLCYHISQISTPKFSFSVFRFGWSPKCFGGFCFFSGAWVVVGLHLGVSFTLALVSVWGFGFYRLPFLCSYVSLPLSQITRNSHLSAFSSHFGASYCLHLSVASFFLVLGC